jgi:hypothetical protein
LFVLQCIPPFAFFRGLLILRDGVAFEATGLPLSDIGDSDVNMDTVYIFLFVEWIILMLLAAYLEAVLPSSIGVKK